MKKLSLLIFATTISVGSMVSAQEYNFLVEKKTSISIGAPVKDLDINGNNLTLLTSDGIYLIDQDGKIKDRQNIRGVRGISYGESSSLQTLNEIDFSSYENNSGEKTQLKFLAGQSPDLYTCRLLLKDGQQSYSSMIVKKDNRESYFRYLIGIPAGLYSDGRTLWYLYNKSIENQNGMLRKYNIATGKLLSEETVPVIEPVGLTVDKDGFIYTYEEKSGSVIKLSVK